MSTEPTRRALAVRLFGIDTRALAALRIALALLALVDLANRLPGLAAICSDAGIAPLALGRALGTTMSLYQLSGGESFALLLAALQAIAAAMLLAGWHTRAASIATWLLVVSLQLRNPFVNNGGDAYLRMLLFWSMFLPLGASASLDARAARRRGAPTGPAIVCTPATAAAMLQLAILYFVAGITKSGPEWSDGSALRIALDQRYWTRDLAFVLAGFPTALSAGTYATRWLEIALPILLFFPFATARVRIAALLGLWVFQAGLASSFVLNLFPWASSAGTLVFLPSMLFDRFARGSGGEALPLAPRARFAVLADAIVVAALAVNLVLAGATAAGRVVPHAFDRAASFVGFEQSWTMYAPSPVAFDLDFEILGHAETGEVERLLGPGTPGRDVAPARTPAPPGTRAHEEWEQRVVALHRQHRLKVFLENGLRMGGRFESLRQGYLAWVCREWNALAAIGARIDAVAFVGESRRTGVDGSAYGSRLQLSERSCAADPLDLGGKAR